jgi:hypothetical protein
LHSRRCGGIQTIGGKVFHEIFRSHILCASISFVFTPTVRSGLIINKTAKTPPRPFRAKDIRVKSIYFLTFHRLYSFKELFAALNAF